MFLKENNWEGEREEERKGGRKEESGARHAGREVTKEERKGRRGQEWEV